MVASSMRLLNRARFIICVTLFVSLLTLWKVFQPLQSLIQPPPASLNFSIPKASHETRASIVQDPIDKIVKSNALVHPSLFVTPLSGTNSSESTTIILNVYKGPPVNLKTQILQACTQRHTAKITSIWIFSFNSPFQNAYKSVVDSIRTESQECKGIAVMFTASEINFKFHGRFLLAPMASVDGAEYLLVVDDDVVIGDGAVRAFVKYMKEKPRLLGTRGQLRSPDAAVPAGWHDSTTISPSKSAAYKSIPHRVDYLCNMWFLKTIWTSNAAFSRDAHVTFYTGEDVHLSYTLRKYLGVGSEVVSISEAGIGATAVGELEVKKYAAHREGRVADVRNDIFRLNLGRGGSVELKGGVEVDQVVLVQNLECALAAVQWKQRVKDRIREFGKNGKGDDEPKMSCLVFTGREENAQEGEELFTRAALTYAKLGNCHMRLWPKWGPKPRPVRYFNMQLGLGLTNSEYPLTTLVSDMIPALAGILGGNRIGEVVVVTGKDCWIGAVYRAAVQMVVGIVNRERVVPIQIVFIDVD